MSVREVKSCKHLITKSEQYLLKLIIIGDCGVGKTNILVRFCDNVYKPNYVATIGVDFKLKSMTIANKKIKFQIWDTAGQQRYRTIAQTYYKGVAGIILAYSITDDRSFQNLGTHNINHRKLDETDQLARACKCQKNSRCE